MKYADFHFLKFDPKPNGVMLLTLNRADAMNATNGRMHWELTKVWDVVDHDPEVRVIVVTGAGDSAFSAGGDLAWISETVGNHDKVSESFKEAGDIVRNMLACEKPIISAINGVAVGAGLAVALLADISIIAEEQKSPMTTCASDYPPAITLSSCGRCSAEWPRQNTT